MKVLFRKVCSYNLILNLKLFIRKEVCICGWLRRRMIKNFYDRRQWSSTGSIGGVEKFHRFHRWGTGLFILEENIYNIFIYLFELNEISYGVLIELFIKKCSKIKNCFFFLQILIFKKKNFKKWKMKRFISNKQRQKRFIYFFYYILFFLRKNFLDLI